MAFRVGQKVVCVDGHDTNIGGKQEIVDGAVYTIIQIITGHRFYTWAVDHADHSVCFHLAEVDRPSGVPFAASRFRPIVERKTDTGFAILTEILNGQRVPEKV